MSARQWPCGCTETVYCRRHREMLQRLQRAVEDASEYVGRIDRLGHPATWAFDPTDHDSEPIVGATRCRCERKLVRYATANMVVLVCAVCDQMLDWPALDGQRFYDQEADSD